VQALRDRQLLAPEDERRDDAVDEGAIITHPSHTCQPKMMTVPIEGCSAVASFMTESTNRDTPTAKSASEAQRKPMEMIR
jgi:hypothetical protein